MIGRCRRNVASINSTILRCNSISINYFTKRCNSNKSNNSRINNGSGIPGQFVYHMINVSKSLQNGRVLFNDVSIGVLQGAKIGILGSNGAGKSSFIKVIAGLDKDFDGEVWTKEGLRIGYLPQEPILDSNKDTLGNILDGLEASNLLKRFDDISASLGDEGIDMDKMLEEQGKLIESIDKLDCWNFHLEVERAMTALRVPKGNSDISTLSGGEKRRVALCHLLLQKPDILLLDEPTNHLDAESVSWLENFLHSYKGAVICITHDRYFLDNVACWILEFDQGRLYSHEGNYSSWLENKHSRLNLDRTKEYDKAKQLQKELEWIREHQGKSKASKSRLNSFQSLKDKEKLENQKLDQGTILIPPGPRLGKKVIQVSNLKKSFNDKILFKDLSFTLESGDVVGIVGANGSGKSTLFKILNGSITPDEGTVEIGESVQMGVVAQDRSNLNDENTIYQEISGGLEYITIKGQKLHVRSYIAAFNLKGIVQEKRIGSLSGGERNRVQIAKELMQGHNVLLLDEPTNDLDVDTLRSLEEALKQFSGAIIIISHDRYFLDRLCTHTLAFEDTNKVLMFPGSYSKYEEKHKPIKEIA